MSESIAPLNPTKALYIKLGEGSSWEDECLQKGIIRFGYKETPFEAAIAGDWETVRKYWLNARGDKGVASRDVTQIRHYFESDEDVVWITFSDGKLWWCSAKPTIQWHLDGKGTYRETINGWHDTDIKDTKLSFDRLSGNLLKVQNFRGTICEVKQFEYVIRKLNGIPLPEVEDAVTAEQNMISTIIPLMHLLSWQDFELLVDLVFAKSGWQRIGHVGKNQKNIDLDLVLPTTGERASVQIKAETNNQGLKDYLQRFRKSSTYDRMFFVWHSGHVDEVEADNVFLINPERLARMVFDAGLTTWLRTKVS